MTFVVQHQLASVEHHLQSYSLKEGDTLPIEAMAIYWLMLCASAGLQVALHHMTASVYPMARTTAGRRVGNLAALALDGPLQFQ